MNVNLRGRISNESMLDRVDNFSRDLWGGKAESVRALQCRHKPQSPSWETVQLMARQHTVKKKGGRMKTEGLS